MVSTSNRHPDGLYENGLNRDIVLPFIREVQQRCEVWEIGGKDDYRMSGGIGDGKNSQRTETFLPDEGEFDSRLETALHGKSLRKVSIPVYGSRKIDHLSSLVNIAARRLPFRTDDPFIASG